MRRLRSKLVAVTMLFVAVACVSEGRSVEVHDQPKSLWVNCEEFYYENEDTLSMRDIAIVLRYDRGEVADSVALNVMTISPDSMAAEEHFTLHIPRIREVRPQQQTFLYRRNVVLGRKGQYEFRLTPDTAVEGISSIGIMVGEPTPTKVE